MNLRIFNSKTNTHVYLECKEYVKYLGILIDSNLTWKHHVDHIASKISKIIGIIARLRHFVPLSTLLTIYQSLVFPYMSYGMAVWGQAAQTHLNFYYFKNMHFALCISLVAENMQFHFLFLQKPFQ